MNAYQLEQLIRQAAASMARSLYVWWPGRGDHELPEATAVMHLASALLDEGCAVFGGVPWSGASKARLALDLLALVPESGQQIRVEVKRAFRAPELEVDLDRVRAFDADCTQAYIGGTSMDEHLGCVLTTVWDPEEVDWWMDPGRDRRWPELATQLAEARVGCIVLQDRVNAQDPHGRTHVLLYAILELGRGRRA